MQYFRRYDPDGSCVIICLRCFATVGIAGNVSAALTLENLHERTRHPIAGQNPASTGILGKRKTLRGDLPRRFVSFTTRVQMQYSALFFLTIVILLYGLPTVLELVAVRYSLPAIAIILFGDLTGCLYLGTVLRSPRAATVLYLSLLVCELGLYFGGDLPRVFLPWMLDLAPTVFVIGKLMSMQAQTRRSSLIAP